MSTTHLTLTEPHLRAGDPPSPKERREALLRLLALLDAADYDFIAPTPASQARVLARGDRRMGATVADLLGWTLPCRPDLLPTDIVSALDAAGDLEWGADEMIRARVRVSRVYDCLFVHSSYPTTAGDSVFLGPDSLRFADYISRHIAGLPDAARILDYGAGAGVGGITAASLHGNALLTLADINAKALFLASTNATFAGVQHRTAEARSPVDIDDRFDLIVTHPPFMIDPDRRAYRDGGDLYGGRLSVDWTLAALNRLAPGGKLVMHTGVSIVAGRDVVRDALTALMPAVGYSYEYRTLDPDIFGDELSTPAYAEVDRIAAIGLCVTRTPHE